MKIKFIAKNGNACDWHRLYQPLNNIDADITMGVYGEDEDPGDCDVYIFNRDIHMSAHDLNILKREKGFKVVMDIDDYWILPPSHYLYQSWIDRGYVDTMISFMSMADLVTTTNQLLADKIKVYNSNVYIYPNGMSFEEPIKNRRDKLRFGYVGGVTHEHDVRLLEKTFDKVGTERFIHDNAEFSLHGYEKHDIWDKMTHIFTKTRSFNIWGSLSPVDYMEHYNDVDVCLIPLVDNTFNAHKSTLKIVEAASRGIPCIVSNVAPYNTLNHIPGILWVNKNADWLKYIRYCIHNKGWVEEQGKALYNAMNKTHNIKDISKLLYEVLSKLVHE